MSLAKRVSVASDSMDRVGQVDALTMVHGGVPRAMSGGPLRRLQNSRQQPAPAAQS